MKKISLAKSRGSSSFLLIKVVSKFNFGHYSEKKWKDLEFGFCPKIDSLNNTVGTTPLEIKIQNLDFMVSGDTFM